MVENTQSVLIVEQDAVLRDVISLALCRHGFKVVSSRDKSEALNLFMQHRPHLLILGVFLQNGNGLDLLGEIKRQGLLNNTAVIVMTALGYREVVQQAMKAGANEFLIKPVDIRALIDKSQKLVSKKVKITNMRELGNNQPTPSVAI